MSGEPKITTDHDAIMRWAEDRGGKPSVVKGTGGEERGGILRINFPGYAEGSLEEISWDEFFKVFDDKDLAFLYQNETAKGEESRFFKLILRGKSSGGEDRR